MIKIYRELTPSRYRIGSRGNDEMIHIVSNDEYIRIHYNGLIPVVNQRKPLTEELKRNIQSEIDRGYLIHMSFPQGIPQRY